MPNVLVPRLISHLIALRMEFFPVSGFLCYMGGAVLLIALVIERHFVYSFIHADRMAASYTWSYDIEACAAKRPTNGCVLFKSLQLMFRIDDLLEKHNLLSTKVASLVMNDNLEKYKILGLGKFTFSPSWVSIL